MRSIRACVLAERWSSHVVFKDTGVVRTLNYQGTTEKRVHCARPEFTQIQEMVEEQDLGIKYTRQSVPAISELVVLLLAKRRKS